MAQKLRDDKIGTITQSSGIITMAASAGSPAWLTIGGQQYKVTSALNLTIPTLTANTLYMVYAVQTSGVVSLVQSTNVNSVGPAGFLSWKLVSAYYSDGNLSFGSFVNITGIPKTLNRITYSGTIVDANNSNVQSGAPLTNTRYWERDGRYGLYSGGYYHQRTVGSNGTNNYYIKVPTQQTAISASDEQLSASNSGEINGFVTGDVGGGTFAVGGRSSVAVPPINGFGLRIVSDTDGGNWGASGAGGVLDAYAMSNTFVGLTWTKCRVRINEFNDTPLVDL